MSAPLRIRPRARPGDAWRIRLLAGLGGARPDPARPRFRAVIYKPERLGDLLLAEKAIRTLADHFGGDRIAVVVSPASEALAARLFPDLTRLSLPLSLGLDGWNVVQALELRCELSRWSCEHLICLRHHRQPLSSAALRWIPAGRRWGVTGHPWMLSAVVAREEGLFDHSVGYPWPAGPGIPSEVAAHAHLLEAVTGAPAAAAGLLPGVDLPPRGPVPGESPTLVVVPWGSGEIKNLTADLITGVMGHMPVHGYRVRIVAEPRRSAEQERLVETVAAAFPHLDVAPAWTTSLEDLHGAIAGATALLSADTFPAHLAAAMDKPLAVLSTGAQPGVFGPWARSDRQRWFVRKMECWGCGWRCRYARPHCLLDVAEEEVARFLAPHLAGDAGPHAS